MAITVGDGLLKLGVDKSRFQRDVDAAGKHVESRMKRMGASVRKAGMAFTAMGVAGAAMIGLLVKSAVDFDKAMREVNTLIGLSEDQMKGMRDEVKALSVEMGIDAIDAAKALYQAISAGQEPTEALKFLQIAARTAVGGITDLETATGGLTSIMNAFGIEADQAEHVADILFTSMKGGITTIGKLSTSFFQVAPLAAAAGVSFEEIAAAVTTLTKQGIPTKIAMTGLRMAIVSLQKPTAEMQDLLGRLGFQTGTAAIEALGLQGTFQALATETGATQEEIVKAVGSVESLQAVLGITGLQAEEFSRQMEAMEGATGASQAAFDEMAKSAAFQMAQAKQAIEAVRRELGEALMPAVLAIVGVVQKMLKPILEWIQENKDLAKWLGVAAVAVTGLMLVLGPLLIILPSLVAAFGLLSVALLGPLAVVAGVVALGVAMKVMIERSKDTGIQAGELRERFVELHGPTSDIVAEFDKLAASGLSVVDILNKMTTATKEQTLAALTAELNRINIELLKAQSLGEAVKRALMFDFLSTPVQDLRDQLNAVNDEIGALLATAEDVGPDIVEVVEEVGEEGAVAFKKLDEAGETFNERFIRRNEEQIQAARDRNTVGEKMLKAQIDRFNLRSTLQDSERQEGESFNDWFERTNGTLIGQIEARNQAEKDALDERIEMGNFWADFKKANDQEIAARAQALGDTVTGITLDTDAKLREIERDRAAEFRQIGRDLSADLITRAEAIVLLKANETSAATRIRIATDMSATLQQIASDLSTGLITDSTASVLTAIALENANLRIAIAKEEAAEIVRSIELQEAAALRLKKVTLGLAADERARLNALLASMAPEGGVFGREIAEREELRGKGDLTAVEERRLRHLDDLLNAYDARLALATGARESEAEARLAGRDQPRFGAVPPGFVPGGDLPPGFGIFDRTLNEIAAEVNRLSARREQTGFLTGSEQQFLQSGYKTANIIFEVDGVKMAEVIGQPLVDVIRVRQGGAVG